MMDIEQIKADRDALVDEFEVIVSDTHDIDTKDRHYAERIEAFLFEHSIGPARIAALEAENKALREVLSTIADIWERPREGLSDFGEREHFAGLLREAISRATTALTAHSKGSDHDGN